MTGLYLSFGLLSALASCTLSLTRIFFLKSGPEAAGKQKNTNSREPTAANKWTKRKKCTEQNVSLTERFGQDVCLWKFRENKSLITLTEQSIDMFLQGSTLYSFSVKNVK